MPVVPLNGPPVNPGRRSMERLTMQNTSYNHALLALLGTACRMLEADRERTLGSPFFNEGCAYLGGHARLWTDAAGVVYLRHDRYRGGSTTVSTADTDDEIVSRWLSMGCPDGVLGQGD